MHTFIVNERNKKEAAKGCNDDHIFAAAILCHLDDVLPLAATDNTLALYASQPSLEQRQTVQAHVAEVQKWSQVRARNNRAPTDAEESAGFGDWN
jgi:hypothetical protein